MAIDETPIQSGNSEAPITNGISQFSVDVAGTLNIIAASVDGSGFTSKSLSESVPGDEDAAAGVPPLVGFGTFYKNLHIS